MTGGPRDIPVPLAAVLPRLGISADQPSPPDAGELEDAVARMMTLDEAEVATLCARAARNAFLVAAAEADSRSRQDRERIRQDAEAAVHALAAAMERALAELDRRTQDRIEAFARRFAATRLAEDPANFLRSVMDELRRERVVARIEVTAGASAASGIRALLAPVAQAHGAELVVEELPEPDGAAAPVTVAWDMAWAEIDIDRWVRELVAPAANAPPSALDHEERAA